MMFKTLVVPEAKEIFYAMRSSCRFCIHHDNSGFPMLGDRYECIHSARPHQGNDNCKDHNCPLIVNCNSLMEIIT